MRFGYGMLTIVLAVVLLPSEGRAGSDLECADDSAEITRDSVEGSALSQQAVAAAVHKASGREFKTASNSQGLSPRKPNVAKAALIGAAIGGGIGIVQGGIECAIENCDRRPERGPLASGLAGATIGAIGGLVIAAILAR